MALEKIFPEIASKEELERFGAVEQKPRGQLEKISTSLMKYEGEGIVAGWIKGPSDSYTLLYHAFVGDYH